MASRRILRCGWCDGLLIEPAYQARANGCGAFSDAEWDAVDHMRTEHAGLWTRYGLDSLDEIRVAA